MLGKKTDAAGRFSFSPETALEDIQCLHAECVADWDWEQFPSLGNSGQASNQNSQYDAEPFPQTWLLKERTALQGELSDVLIYLVA